MTDTVEVEREYLWALEVLASDSINDVDIPSGEYQSALHVARQADLREPRDRLENDDSLLAAIRKGDRESTNGGHYVGSELNEEAERLVEAGKVVRLKNPAGVSPIYVPMDSDHYSDDRLERMRERQSSKAND